MTMNENGITERLRALLPTMTNCVDPLSIAVQIKTRKHPRKEKMRTISIKFNFSANWSGIQTYAGIVYLPLCVLCSKAMADVPIFC